MTGTLPEGWRLKPGPEGMARITVAARSPKSSALSLLAAGLCCAALAGVIFTGLHQGAGGWRGLRLTLLLPLGLLLVGFGLQAALGREEWRVGADLLEVRQRILGIPKLRQFRGASLRLVTSASSASPRARRLAQAARAGSPSRGGGNWWGLWVTDARGTQCLYSTARGWARPEEVRAVGEYLAERTGWPLVQVKRR